MTGTPISSGVDRPAVVGTTVRRVAALALVAVVLFVGTTGEWTVVSAGSHDGALVGKTVAVAGYLPAAIRATEREREQLQREREAFDRFVAEVKSIAVRTNATTGVAPALVERASAHGSEVRDVQAAYRETVMAVDHFHEEYGEGLYENMTLELSEHVASALTDGYQFTQPLKQAVIQQARLASSRRESLRRTVATERDSLERARKRLREIESDQATEATDAPLSDRTLTELFAADRRLEQRRNRYEKLLDRRQHHVHSADGLRSDEAHLLQPYLYEALPVDFPVLATVAQRCERLDDRQRAVHREITDRCI